MLTSLKCNHYHITQPKAYLPAISLFSILFWTQSTWGGLPVQLLNSCVTLDKVLILYRLSSW